MEIKWKLLRKIRIFYEMIGLRRMNIELSIELFFFIINIYKVYINGWYCVRYLGF